MDEYKKCMYNDIIYIYMYVYIYIYIYILRDQKTVNTDIFDIFGVCVCVWKWCTANSHGLGYRIIDSWPHPSTDLTLDAPLVDPEINKSTPKKCDLLKKDGFSENPVPQCEAPEIATVSWFITPITMVYGTYNYSYWGL